jgi:hypothetical protein
MKTKYLLGIAVLGLAAASVTPARAGVSFHISLGVPLPPPPVFHMPVPAPCSPRVIVAPPPVVCAPPPVVVYHPQPVCAPAPVFVPPGHAKRHGHPRYVSWGHFSHR